MRRGGTVYRYCRFDRGKSPHRRVYPYYLAPLIRLFARPGRNFDIDALWDLGEGGKIATVYKQDECGDAVIFFSFFLVEFIDLVVIWFCWGL